MRLISDMNVVRFLALFLGLLAGGCSPADGQSPSTSTTGKPAASKAMSTNTTASTSTASTQKIVIGGGCFWCIEAVYQRVPGVKKIVSGYAGGYVLKPTYKQVCTGTTGHAEVVEVEFDPARVKLDQILDVFFAAHDPTTLNRQGHDEGTQYRSVIFYANEEQQKAAEAAKVRAKDEWQDPIVTEISPLKNYFPAEDYHQNYFNQNANSNPYCSAIIVPKLRKLREKGIIQAQPAN